MGPIHATSSSWLVSDRARRRLEALTPVLERLSSAENPGMHEISTYLVGLGGKRLRPALLFVAAALGRDAESDELAAAAAVELVHVASLYHDDVMDQATLRRGEEAVNRRWDNLSAVLAGTYLFSRAAEALAGLPDGLSEIASRAWADVCAGQIHETENAYNLELTVEEHLAVLEKKTATLFELPCRLGARLGGLGAEPEAALARYGQLLGVAFQLADDALDVRGSEQRLGKAPGVDLRRGVYSSPLLWTLRNGKEDGRRAADLLALMHPTDDDLDEVLGLVRAGRGVEIALLRASSMVEEAIDSLAVLPAGPERRSLENLAAFVVERSS